MDLLLADTPDAGVSSAVALLWGGIATAAGGVMATVITKLWLELAAQRVTHAAELLEERKAREALRIECAQELRALHGTHAAALQRFADAMRAPLRSAGSSEDHRGHHDHRADAVGG